MAIFKKLLGVRKEYPKLEKNLLGKAPLGTQSSGLAATYKENKSKQ